MQIKNTGTKELLIQRLRRIEGQVRGVQNMLADERDCREIMQQLAAIHSAVQSTSRAFLQDYATGCLVDLETPPGISEAAWQQKSAALVQDMITLLDKTP